MKTKIFTLNIKKNLKHELSKYDGYDIPLVLGRVFESNKKLNRNTFSWGITKPLRFFSKLIFHKKFEMPTIKVHTKFKNVKFEKDKLVIKFKSYIINNTEEDLASVRLHISDDLYIDLEIKEENKKLSLILFYLKYRSKKYYFDLDEIIERNIQINNILYIKVVSQKGVEKTSYLNKKLKTNKNCKMYYVPIISRYINQFCIIIRRSSRGNIILNKRLKEEYEYSGNFCKYENPITSMKMYFIGNLARIFSFKKINLYYEKFSAKAEEGVFELCRETQNSKVSKNYYIIDENSIDYEKIKNYKFVIKKYSEKYYKLLYRANAIIASEAPMHINILRSSNKFLRKSIYLKKNVFLQHGIIYMKNLGVNSAFIKGKEAECDYILVSSEKEKQVVHNMLKMKEENILNTGIAIFSKIQYKHINQNSKDIITVMLTWKPYEEHLYDFTQSSYYKYIIKITDILKKFISGENIKIVAHPKVYDLLKNTDLKDNIYDGPVSEVLKMTKLMITDYSSICYNSFYQGAGVIFYQEDIKRYEEELGELIPQNNEYIGERAFNIKELEKIIAQSVQNGSISLEKIRTYEHENNYATINEHNDGENIERIIRHLKILKFI